MPISTSVPVTIEHPEIPYDKLAPSLTISPLFEERYIGAATVITLTPYRVLPDGRIDVNRAAVRVISIADAYAAAQDDPILAAAIAPIYSAINTYVQAKGY